MKGSASMPPAFRANYDALLELGQQVLGFDPMLLVNIGLMLGAVFAFLHYTGQSLYRYAQQIILSSVHINEDDQLYDQVMRFMSDTYLETKQFRSVSASTPNKTTWEDEEESALAQAEENGGVEFDRGKFISYRTAINRAPIRLAPFQGGHHFRYRGRWLYFVHRLDAPTMSNPFSGPRERGHVTLRCFGRSLEPIKRLLSDAQEHALERERGTTTIYRGTNAWRANQLQWQKVLSRPARDIRTVILDQGKKRSLLEDINEYLQNRRWYANRGIPYRRGYLFSGAPGMGKTSLTAALAGVFGLNIYVLSLLDPSLNESNLMRLLGEVPSRCIVLLEDIDAAGLNRQVADEANSENKSEQRRGGRRGGGTGGAAAAVPAGGAPVGAAISEEAPSPSNISLSGLLNAIDGVSSHEGHILIMTTNNPDQLDRALVRPGRVDVHVDFELPRRPEIRALFLSMYHDLKLAGAKQVKEIKSEKATNDQEQYQYKFEHEAGPELSALAEKFADALPEMEFSLAAIQGYLQQHKYDPETACQFAGTWAKQVGNESKVRHIQNDQQNEDEDVVKVNGN